MTDHFTFSSHGRPSDEAFAEYARLYSHGSDVARGDGPFRAEVRAWRMHGVILFDRRLNGVVHSREARVRSDGYDHIVLHAVLEGHLLGSAASGFDVARPGDVVLIDAGQPSRTAPRDAHMLTVSIGRHLVEAATGNARMLHGQLLSPPSTLLLQDFILSLIRWAPTLENDDMPAYSRALVELLSAALSGAGQRGSEVRRLNFLRRESVEQCIAARLGDRTLSAEAIGAATGISRSALYRLLHDQGGVARLIQTRRLQAVRSAIDNGSDASLAELAHSFGFSSESHMSRLFADAFGQPPGAYRQAITGLEDGDAKKGRHRWLGWMHELN